MKSYVTLIIFILFAFFSIGQDCNYEGYYLYQNTYPNDEGAFWFPNDTEVQGVTNDGKYWYITTTGHKDVHGTDYWGKLWRIPKSVPLGSNSTSNPEVVSIDMFDIPELNISGNPFWHWGDPDHYVYEGRDYILVPIYPKDGNSGIIACFSSEPFRPLEYISYAHIPLRPGWCAIDNEGYLYSSTEENDEGHKSLQKYEVNWNALTSTTNHNVLSSPQTISLIFKGSAYSGLKHMQGGEFSPSNELLYLVSGGAKCLGGGSGDPAPSDGIHVFQTSNWKEIETSVKSWNDIDYFLYSFDNNCINFGTGGSESPEGLTIWDLDDGSADNISGQLHVLIFHWRPGNIFTGSNNHKLSMHHFSKSIHIDKNSNGGSGLIGNPNNPFKTVNEAYSDHVYPIWDGAQMVITKGTYSDTGVYNKRIRLTSKGGSVIIGKQ